MGRKRGQEIDGVLLLDKQFGYSSNQSLQRVRRMLDAKKGGHTGTLDPFATGLLVCCFGKATKICGTMLDADKSYIATLQFGTETDSGDLTGTVVQQAQLTAESVTREKIDMVLPQFRGSILQIPPMHSALKRDGRPLYEYARQGIVLEREPRAVVIHDLQVQALDETSMVLAVDCSKGTYIRTLAQDIGRALGCFAHLTALRRTRVGPFDLTGATTIDKLEQMENRLTPLIPLNEIPDGLLPSNIRQKEDTL